METFKTKQLKILLVDDHPMVLKVLWGLFKNMGYMVDTAVTGEEAVMKATHGYDLILMDMGLPGINGMEAVRTIRQMQNKEKPPYVIVLTAYIMDDLEKECLLAGANYVEHKPMDRDKIKKALALCTQK